MLTAWLIDHAGALYVAALLGGFSVVALWEGRAPLRPATAPLSLRWTANLALLAINTGLMQALLPLAAVAAALLAQQHGWGVLSQLGWHGWTAVLAGLLLLDLVRWLLHATLHRVACLWRLHRVHHSDTDYDSTIGVRFHPLEALFSSAVLLVAVILLGVPPLAVLLSDAATLAFGFFTHANVSLPPRLDGWLRRVFVTPDLHRVHHSCARDESMSNFGGVLSVWDRAFGTLKAAPAAGALGMHIGLEELRDARALTLPRLLWLPFEPVANAPAPARATTSASDTA